MTVEGREGSGFDVLLEKELHRRYGRLTGARPLASQAAFQQGGKKLPALSAAAAALSTKAAAGVAAALLVAGGGSVAAAAATGNPNPMIWGKTVTAAVDTCKAKLAEGDHGIGKCVSAVARQHGEAQRAEHATDPSPAAGARPSETPDSRGQGHGKPSTAPAGAPSPHPTGRPDELPTPAQSASGQAGPGQAGHPTPQGGKPSTPPGH